MAHQYPFVKMLRLAMRALPVVVPYSGLYCHSTLPVSAPFHTERKHVEGEIEHTVVTHCVDLTSVTSACITHA